ncbi:MAG: bifunctional oligoribonuclease/PAP phosphatase NrnA [Bacteroidales bacterium]|nr:bifunctional oligoribonuclease/PAP phosphatase NrnA [Bacteroidales bacterium]MBK7171822.1 bifunctional oligoribonuclease/PAP phosphatase NrnA [Bacteroidales bacterium]
MNRLDNVVEYFRKLISSPVSVLITAHYNPDGDTIGASLALMHFLKPLGHDVKVLVPNEPPSFLHWMPGCSELIIYQSDPEVGNELISDADLIFCMDYNSSSRVKFFSKQLDDSQATKVMIDHHPFPSNEFDLSISVTEVSSTSELLFNLLDEAGYSESVTREMAECMFTGIMTDTGSFSYSCNRPETFNITSRLISTGINIEKIHRMVYDTYSESRMRLLGHCLGARLKVLPQFSTAYIWLTKSDLEDFDYKPGDTEGVVNYALSIQNVCLAALFTEREDRIRISLRSKGDFSVNEFARKHFQGGGHKNAAGADSMESMELTLKHFEALLVEYQASLTSNMEDYL